MAKPIANAGADIVIDLDAVSLPQDADLNGSGTPGTGGVSIASYSWTILRGPTGSAAALDDAAAQNPVLLGVDTWANYLLFLVVTDDLGASSETDWKKAPDSAFAVVRVKAATTGMQRFAGRERNFTDNLNVWPTAIQALREDVDALESPAGAVTATTAALGVTKLAEASTDPANPKAVLADWVCLPVSRESADIIAGSGAANYDMAVLVPFGMTIKHVSMVFADGWDGDFAWKLASKTQFETGSLNSNIPFATLSPNDHTNPQVESAACDQAVSADAMLVCNVTTNSAPASPDGYVVAHIWGLRAGQA